MVICLERGADLHTAQLMPLPLTISCSSKIQIGFTVLVPAYSGCPGKEAVKCTRVLLLNICIADGSCQQAISVSEAGQTALRMLTELGMSQNTNVRKLFTTYLPTLMLAEYSHTASAVLCHFLQSVRIYQLYSCI